MPIAIKHKSSSTASAVPAANDLVLRELAVNTTDGKLFIKTGAGGVVTFSNDSNSPNRVLFDSDDPGSGEGVNNNFWLNTTSKDFFYKSGGTWTLIANLGGGATFVDDELVGVGDNTTTVFNLDSAPVSGSVHVYVGGFRKLGGAGNDYTISGGEITFATAPADGENIVADYRTA